MVALRQGRTEKEYLIAVDMLWFLKTLPWFPDTEGVQAQGCRALFNALYQLPNRCDRAAGTIGTIEAILKALTAFPQNQFLQDYGMGAIDKLLFSVRENEIARMAMEALVKED
jgi:hypothetical protein